MVFLFQNPELPLADRVNDLIKRLTIEEKISLLSTRQSSIERLKIPAYRVGGEAAHGVVDRDGGKTTVFPQPIGLSSTWNKSLLKAVGSAIGDEARTFYYEHNEKTGLTLWAPTIDMERDPRWGRTEEAYGEDPYLTGELAKHLIIGMQGEDPFYLKMVAAPKHFYGNNNEYGRESISNSIDPRNRHEYYLKAFESAFTQAKAASMMTAYNGINGIPCMQINEIKEIVRDKWGMDGFVVSDGGALTLNVDQYQYYNRYSEALADALKKGIDCFVDDKEKVEKAATEALEQGLINENDITLAISRTLNVRFRLGQFDQSQKHNPYARRANQKLCSDENAALAEQSTLESIVLLKNEANQLPLKEEEIQSVAVIGPTANQVFRDWYTGYPPYKITPRDGIEKRLKGKKVNYVDSFDKIAIKHKETNQFLTCMADDHLRFTNELTSDGYFIHEDWGWNSHLLKCERNERYVTLPEDRSDYQATKEEVFDWFVREKIGFYRNSTNSNVYHLTSWDEKPLATNKKGALTTAWSADNFEKIKLQSGIETAVKQAKQSDVAIVCVGNHPMINGKETEDRPSIELAKHQQKLIKAVHQANPNTIVVVIGSYPFALNWEQKHIPAILYSSHGSQALGNALAKVLFGDFSPSGKLSMTWYESTDQLPSIFDYDIINGKRTYMYAEKNILYPFGHGLHYGKVSYQNLTVDPSDVKESNQLKLSVTLTNESDRTLQEVVQVYVRYVKTQLKRPNKQLVAFDKVTLAPKQKRVIDLSVQADQLQAYNVEKEQLCLESGKITLAVGNSSDNMLIESPEIQVLGTEFKGRTLRKLTKAENYDDYRHVVIGKGEHEQNCVVNKKQGWICFKQVDLFQASLLELRLATDGGQGSIEIYYDRLDSQPVDQKNIQVSAPFEWFNESLVLNKNSETHDLFIKMNGPIYLLTVKTKEE